MARVSGLPSVEIAALFGAEEDSDSFPTWKSVLELSAPGMGDRFWRCRGVVLSRDVAADFWDWVVDRTEAAPATTAAAAAAVELTSSVAVVPVVDAVR